MNSNSPVSDITYFEGGGSMGHLILSMDWTENPLGDPTRWPHLLKSSTRTMLLSPQPMAIVWGPDFRLLYNDAFAELLTSRKSEVLGEQAESVWVDKWEEVYPAFKTVVDTKAGCAGTIFLPDENSCKHFCTLTALLDELGVANGILCICNTTSSSGNDVVKHNVEPQLKNIFQKAPMAMCILRGSDHIVETVNASMLKLWGKTLEDVEQKSIFLAVPEAANQGFEELLAQVFNEVKTIVAQELPLRVLRNGNPTQIYVKFIFEPIREEDDSVSGIIAIADEITEQVEARKRVELSEMRHKLAIEAAALGSFEWDVHTQEFIYSDRLAQIFGYKSAEGIKQQDLINLIHPDDLQVREEAHRKALENGVLFYEVRIVWRDNSLHWIRLNGKILFSDDHQPQKIVGTILDITDHKIQSAILERKVEDRTRTLKQMNEELQQSEERYHRMTDEIQDYAILLLDTSGNILNWNKGAQSIKGYTEAEAIGRHISMFYQEEDKQAKLPEKLINEATINGRSLNEGYRVRKDGSKFWASVAITALHDNNGNIIGFSKVTRDLTERKIAEDKMQQYNAELEFQNKELEQFAYVTSHDLQEPLRKIQMFTDLLYKNINNRDAVNKYFGKINNSASRMVDLIKSVLNYSKLSSSTDQFVKTDLNQILTNVLTDFELLIEEKKAVIKKDKLPCLTAIPLQINQLFSNLIGNSLKFTDVQPQLTISHKTINRKDIPFQNNLQNTNYLEITFSDNGIGFDQKYVSQIFAAFQRLNERAAYGGTGIGLALCKKIVENHRGMITAQSEPGKGASFFIYLPVEK